MTHWIWSTHTQHHPPICFLWSVCKFAHPPIHLCGIYEKLSCYVRLILVFSLEELYIITHEKNEHFLLFSYFLAVLFKCFPPFHQLIKKTDMYSHIWVDILLNQSLPPYLFQKMSFLIALNSLAHHNCPSIKLHLEMTASQI